MPLEGAQLEHRFADIKAYLPSVKMLTLMVDEKESLAKLITVDEHLHAVSTALIGKAPGPVGLTALCYKMFFPQFTPFLRGV